MVVTNPTHFAIALKYDQRKGRAPIVVAKGADEMAHRIRQIALIHQVPIVERPPLAAKRAKVNAAVRGKPRAARGRALPGFSAPLRRS